MLFHFELLGECLDGGDVRESSGESEKACIPYVKSYNKGDHETELWEEVLQYIHKDWRRHPCCWKNTIRGPRQKEMESYILPNDDKLYTNRMNLFSILWHCQASLARRMWEVVTGEKLLSRSCRILSINPLSNQKPRLDQGSNDQQ